MAIEAKTCIDMDNVEGLCKSLLSSIDKYRATTKELDRVRAVEAATNLTRSLEKPADAIYRLFLSPAILMAVKVASDLDMFSILSTSSSSITCQELAARKGASVELTERIMRVLVCGGFAVERGPGKYTASAMSDRMTDRTVLGPVNSLFMDFLPIIHQTPEFLQKTGYRNPEDPKNGPFQYAYKTPLTCWDWLAQNPPVLDRFDTYMEGHKADCAHWTSWFPVQHLLLDDVVADDRTLLVDIAGGRGHDLMEFKQRFPDAHGALVLEDLPAVIDDIQSLDSEIKRIKHDFFQPQPVKGARIYYMKHIMHDWSDENCKVILGHIAAAMEEGYSKLLIEDHILPDENAAYLESLMDMIVMVWCPGNERTRQRWTKLLESVDLEVKKFWLPDGLGPGIVEAELKQKPKSLTYNVSAEDTQPIVYSHINGTLDEILDRFQVSELCKGWPVYRDASEWSNYRDLFVKDGGFVWTTWSGGLSVDEFIKVSREGRERGDFIMHRENSTLVDLNPVKLRAVGKMKATITQRFNIQGCSVDIECDCRFQFFCKKIPSKSGSLEWKTQYVKLIYEKDKMIPVDGQSVPKFDEAQLNLYPEGYRYLGLAQSTLGHQVLPGLPTLNNKAFFEMYDAINLWLQGDDIGRLLGVPETRLERR